MTRIHRPKISFAINLNISINLILAHTPRSGSSDRTSPGGSFQATGAPMDGREPRKHPCVPPNRLAASHGKNAWYQSAVLEAQSTPCSPQFFIQSLESIWPSKVLSSTFHTGYGRFLDLVLGVQRRDPGRNQRRERRNKRPRTST